MSKTLAHDDACLGWSTDFKLGGKHGDGLDCAYLGTKAGKISVVNGPNRRAATRVARQQRRARAGDAGDRSHPFYGE
jgi:hypothetical protein